MYSVLVVDDSAFDRHLAGELLRRAGGLEVGFAHDGAEALRLIAAAPPDIVLADLQMPGMDGLQLVGAVRALNPSLPLVLMTGHGSEEIAVRALQRGAASYVPKRALAQRLTETIRSVLDLADSAKARGRVFDFITRSETQFLLGNDRHAMSPVVDHLVGELRRTRSYDETRLLQLAVALREALSNAIYHGNLEVGSDLHDAGSDAFERLADERRHTPPYRDRRVHVRALQTPEQVTYTIRDEGPGFDPSRLPAPAPEALDRASGRGLLLIRSFLQEVRFNAAGNEITLVARLRQEPTPPAEPASD
jgi:CheY-like chemotaxis protein/anti-sigma regulatory factor (Ser/Thr protein kinase)